MKIPPPEEIVMGVHSIGEILDHYPKKLLQVFIQDSMKKNLRKKTLFRRLEEKRISIRVVSKQELEKICGSSSHQGFVAFIKKRQFQNFPRFLDKQREKKRSCILVLDHMQDPHNVGAIFRSAECFGVDGIIFSTKHGPSITPSVSKVSSGASEHLPLLRLSSLESAVDLLRKEKYTVLSACITEKAVDCTHFSYPQKMVLILGAEGEGISSSLIKKSDQLLYIPMRGKISSLNVSAAAAVLLAFATYRSIP